MQRYQVKWQSHTGGETLYGIYINPEWDKKAYKGLSKGMALVSDAILPTVHCVPEEDLVDVPISLSLYRDEYQKYIDEAFKEAQKVSDKVGGKVAPGALFGIGVADGTAYYVVTRVWDRGRVCDVAWRGYGGGDRYTDHYFRWGRVRVPVSEIKRYVQAYQPLPKPKTPKTKG